MLLTILVIMYVIACLFLILIVLLQAGKGGGMGAAFGGGGASGSTVFGGRGAATLLGKMTWVMAFLFITLSVGISISMRADMVKVDPNKTIEQPAQEDGAAAADQEAPAEGKTEEGK